MESDIYYLLESQKQKILLVIYPHPDDETIFAGGLLCIAKKLGYKTIVCILTSGGAGQMHIHPRGRSIKQVRLRELETAAKILQVDKLIVKDFEDAHLRETTQAWKSEVLDLIKKEKPGIVVTYDNTGVTGHPDHIILSQEVFSVIKLHFPKITLLWSTLPKNLRHLFGKPELLSRCPDCTCFLSLSKNKVWLTKLKAANAYKSQRFGPTVVHPFITILLMMFKFKNEWYHRVDLQKNYEYKFVKFDI